MMTKVEEIREAFERLRRFMEDGEDACDVWGEFERGGLQEADEGTVLHALFDATTEYKIRRLIDGLGIKQKGPHMTPAIPARFLAGSAEPAVAYTVTELRELLAELPGTLKLDFSVSIFADMDRVELWHNYLDEPLADPDGDFDLDAVELRHETGGES